MSLLCTHIKYDSRYYPPPPTYTTGVYKQPKVAIVVPVYNVAPYLSECLDSILTQTYTNFTVFAVDDGSTDESGAILDECASKDTRFVVIRQKNGGLSAARNAALDLIERDETFEYIAFVDSDDKVLPEFLSHFVQNAVQTQADISVCGFFKFNDEGRTKTEGVIQTARTIDQEEFVELIFSMLRWEKTCGAGGMVWEKLFTASSIRSIRFPSNRDVLEDEIFCLQAALRAQIFSYLPETLYGYRQRPDSIIRSERFAWQMFKGRALCVDVAKGLSDRSAMVVVSAFADAAVNLFKDAQSLPVVDLKPYKALVLEAAEKGIIRYKTSKRYMLFCDHPSRARFFRFKRKVIKTIQFWKDESKVKSIKLTD
ncbi:glycosyltransferase family 2 protein [Sutterella wadsworthensis]|uniref:glycosyltransferase family 2 protein n=4 Tax=Sutterella wadsworthensis TaxID=40545 RepID=UPI001FAF44ED|nr:glycosyltransferase [Sutterella wadsworthensis]